MMRRQSSDSQQYDDDSTHHQNNLHDFESHESSTGEPTAACTINNDGQPQSHQQRPWIGEEDPAGAQSFYTPWNNQPSGAAPPPPSISVQMSIWQDLCGDAGHHEEDWRNNDKWRRMEDEDTSRCADQEHEERRILERFASAFPKGGRVSLLNGGGVEQGGLNGGGSGSSTPKSGRRRNKRKGCDSPRPTVEDSSKESPPITDPSSMMMEDQITEESLEFGQDLGQGQQQQQRHHCQQLNFMGDLVRLRETGNEDHGGNEPVVSHGMRPARGWASLELLSDLEDEAVTVSPRVLSPIEMEEPAGSYHALRFAHGRAECVKEPQERRTTFLALGNLINGADRRSAIGRPVVDPADEHPAAARAKQLVQLIYSLKEKVKLYEDAFEQRHGYRPSHHQKMDDRTTKRLLTELARARKEMKQLKERYHLGTTEPVDVLMEQLAETSTSRVSDSSSTTTTTSFLRQDRPCLATVEQTVIQVQEHLKGNRQLAGRSEMVDELNAKEVLDEKLAVQRALLYVESLHGRPTSFGHKDLLRPLYDRYRILKRMVVRSGLSRAKEEICDLAPILEYETLELGETWSNGLGTVHRHSAPPTPSIESMEDSPIGDPRPQVPHRHLMTPITSSELRSESCLLTSKPSWTPSSEQCCKRQRFSLNIEENLHALPLNQLVEQMRHVREEKRRLRRTIRDLEASDLLRQRSIHREDVNAGGAGAAQCCSLESVYGQYRHARAKLRLLEALVAKHDGSATL